MHLRADTAEAPDDCERAPRAGFVMMSHDESLIISDDWPNIPARLALIENRICPCTFVPVRRGSPHTLA